MQQYYQDRWTGTIRTQHELRQMVERNELPRFQIARRFRALPEASCRLFDEVAYLAARAERWPESRSA